MAYFFTYLNLMEASTGHACPYPAHPKVKNQRLAAVGYLWTFAALRLSTGARAHYDRRRVTGDRHTAAQRHLFNRFLGCLYYCLQTGQTYAEDQAFPSAQPIAA